MINKQLKPKTMKHDAIKIHYPGSEISVNHYLGRRKGGGYYIKPEATEWKTEFQWLLKHCHLEDYRLPLEVTCSGWFKDERSAPDLSNLSKIIMDSIQELIHINDSNFRWHDGTRNIGVKEEPYLIIAFSERETPPDTLQSKSSVLNKQSSYNVLPKRKYIRKRK